MSRTTRIVIGVLLAAACSKQDDGTAADKTPAPAPSPTAPVATAPAATAPAATAPAAKGTSKYTYPPPGPGPHEGFDLAAIHAKLQGAWLVRGGFDADVPVVWSLDGDTLVQIGENGARATSTLRLLSPCHYVEGAADGSSGTYSTFVFDGDTLYLGLGSAGLVQGDRTIACLAGGNYVLAGDACTQWTKIPFSRPGDQEWEKNTGECGYRDDGKRFQGDDTRSKRPIFGAESLDVKGGVLLTRQMANNRAERFADLDAALAKQRLAIDAKVARTQVPADLPFQAWGVAAPAAAPSFASNAPVWAAAVSREGRWDLRLFRFKSFEADVLWLRAAGDVFAPPAFVRAPDGAAPGRATPALLGIGALMPYGRFVKLDGARAIVQYRSGNRVEEKPIDAASVLPLAPKAWQLGAPVAYKLGDAWAAGRLAHATDADAYVLTGKGVEKLAKADVRLVDTARRWRPGQKVWAMRPSGFSPLTFVEGKIDKVHADGLYYTIKTASGVFDQDFAGIVAEL